MYSTSPSSGYNFPTPPDPLRDAAGRSLLSAQLFDLDRLVSSLPQKDSERNRAPNLLSHSSTSSSSIPAVASASLAAAGRAERASAKAAYAARPPGSSYLSTEPEMLRIAPPPRTVKPLVTTTTAAAAAAAAAAADIPLPVIASSSLPLPTSSIIAPPAIASFGEPEWRAQLHARIDSTSAETGEILSLLRKGAEFLLVAPGKDSTSGVSVYVQVLTDLSALEFTPTNGEGDVFLVPISALAGVELDAQRARLRLLPAVSDAATAELVAVDALVAADWVAGIAVLAALGRGN